MTKNHDLLIETPFVAANENQKCMTSINQRLQVAFRQASEVPINAVWIDMRVELLEVVAPGPNNKDSQCISRDRSISGGEFYSVTFGCSVRFNISLSKTASKHYYLLWVVTPTDTRPIN